MDFKVLIERVDKLQEWVEENYNPEKCGWTPARSFGDYDDCFHDGASGGISYAAYEVGCILGMKLKEPAVPNYEE